MNRRGGLFTGWNEDAWGVNTERSYKNVPFAWSPRGWGLFAHSLARTLHGVGYPPWSHRSYVLVCEEEGLDLFFLAGSPEEILGAYASLTGFPPPVPRWSYGVWWSRCYYRTPEEALGVAKELRRRGMPGDVLVLDGRAWLDVETRCTLDWDGRRYPDPEGFLRELRGLGFRVCLWEYPYVSVHNPLFRELEAQGFFLRDGQGKAYVYHWDPEPFGELLTPLPPSGILDFTKEEVVRWWKERHQRLFALGVDVMKTDFGEQVPADALAANGDTGRRLHNAYALLYNRAVYEATPERLVFARSGFAGSQRYPVHWGGDPQADWEGLGASIRGGLSWGLSGGAYYAHDIGGFYGTPTAELYVRWLQAGVFFSHLRFHGTSPREPWHFGPEAEALVRAWLRLRMRLVPYVEKSALSLVPMGLPLA
ncbi:MAG: alpha-xylosidase, partial [Thermus sp.]